VEYRVGSSGRWAAHQTHNLWQQDDGRLLVPKGGSHSMGLDAVCGCVSFVPFGLRSVPFAPSAVAARTTHIPGNQLITPKLYLSEEALSLCW